MTEGVIYAIEDHYLYISADSGRSYQRRGMLPKPDAGPVDRIKDFIARRPLVRHIRRNRGPEAVVVLASGTVLVFYDRIYRSADGGWTFEAVPGTRIDQMQSGFPSSSGRAVGPGDTVYVGEYVNGTTETPVRIFRGVDDGARWELAYAFAAGEIVHIHGIFWDPFRRRYWVTTGDLDSQIKLAYTEDNFETLQILGCCSQEWRIVDLIITESALVWGTDDDQRAPGIYRYDFGTRSVERVADLENPSYNAALMADGSMAISTTFEPGSPFTRVVGPPAATALWVSPDGFSWKRLLSMPADSAGLSHDIRPQIQFPAGDPLPWLLATPWYTSTDDFTLLQFATEAAGYAWGPAGR